MRAFPVAAAIALSLASQWSHAQPVPLGLKLAPSIDLDSASVRPRMIPAAGGNASQVFPHSRLSDLVARAVERSQLMVAAAAQVRGGEAGIDQARALMRPNVSAQARAGRATLDNSTLIQLGDTSTGASSGAANYRQLALTLSMPVLRMQSGPEQQAAEETRNAARSRLDEVRLDLTLKVVDAYLQAARLEGEMDSLRAEKQLLERQLALHERRMGAGVATMVDVLETRARLADLEVQFEITGASAQAQRLELARLTAGPIPVVAPLRSDLAFPELDATEASASLSAQSGNPGLQRARAEFLAAESRARAQRAQGLPAVNLAARVDQSRTEGFTPTRTAPNGDVSLSVNVPLGLDGLNSAQQRQALAEADRLRAVADDLVQTIQTSISVAYSDHARARAQERARKASAEIAAQALEMTQRAFVAGIRSNIDVLNAERQLADAERELVRVRTTVLSAHARILALTGTIDAETLKKWDQLFRQ